MTAFYGDFDRDAQEAESLKTIATALELGVNMLDTAWIYQVMQVIEIMHLPYFKNLSHFH